MNIFAVIGKIVPWALGAIAGLLSAFGVLPSWWPTVVAVVTGILQLLISLGPKAPAAPVKP